MRLYKQEKYGISKDIEGLNALYYKAKKELLQEYKKDPNPDCGYWIVEEQYMIESPFGNNDDKVLTKEYDWNKITIYFILLSNYDLSSEFCEDKKASEDYWNLVKRNLAKIHPTLFSSIDHVGGASNDKSKSVYIVLRSSNIDLFLKNEIYDTTYLKNLYHEVTHQYDALLSYHNNFKKQSIRNSFSSSVNAGGRVPILFGDIETNFKDDKEKSLFEKACYLMYILWDSSELNAHQINAGNILAYVIRPSYRGNPLTSDYKRLQVFIDDLSSYSGESFWELLRLFMLGNSSSHSIRSTILDQSTSKFKIWFIKETSKRLKKFYDKTVKNTLSMKEQSEENEKLASAIMKHLPSDKGFISFNIEYYFPRVAYSYPVSIKITWDNNITDIEKFNKKGNVNISIPKLHFNKDITFDDLTMDNNNRSFYSSLVDGDKRSTLFISSLLNSVLDIMGKE